MANSVYTTKLGSTDTYHTAIGDGSQTSEARVQLPFPCAGYAKNLRVRLSVDPDSGNSRTITFYRNGATPLYVTITGTAGGTALTGENTADFVLMAPGDYISIRQTTTGTPVAADVYVAWEFTANTSGETLGGGSHTAGFSSGGTGTTRYYSLAGYSATGFATEVAAQCVMPIGATFKKLYTYLATSPGGGQTATCTLMVDGVASDLVTTYTADNGLKADTSNTAVVTAGQKVCLRVVWSATASASNFRWGVCALLGTDGGFCLHKAGQYSPTSTSTLYQYTEVGYNAWGAAAQSNVLPTCTLKSMYVDLDTAPTAGSRAFTLYNSLTPGDTVITETLSAGATGNHSEDVAVADYDLFTTKCVSASATATATTRVSYYGITVTGGAVNPVYNADPQALTLAQPASVARTTCSFIVSPQDLQVEDFAITVQEGCGVSPDEQALVLEQLESTVTLDINYDASVSSLTLEQVLGVQIDTGESNPDYNAVYEALALAQLTSTVAISSSYTPSPQSLSLSQLGSTITNMTNYNASVQALTLTYPVGSYQSSTDGGTGLKWNSTTEKIEFYIKGTYAGGFVKP